MITAFPGWQWRVREQRSQAMARSLGDHEASLPVSDTLGQTLIPAINKLQDVFAQVQRNASV